MTINELIQILQKHQENIVGEGDFLTFHDTESHVSFYLTNADGNGNLELDLSYGSEGIELDLMPGCQCPQGFIFYLQQKS